MPDNRVKISKEWTPIERLKIVVILTDLIRDDVNLGIYGQVGRPNVQSVHEFIAATPTMLEESREYLEDLINDHPFASSFSEQYEWENLPYRRIPKPRITTIREKSC